MAMHRASVIWKKMILTRCHSSGSVARIKRLCAPSPTEIHSAKGKMG